MYTSQVDLVVYHKTHHQHDDTAGVISGFCYPTSPQKVSRLRQPRAQGKCLRFPPQIRAALIKAETLFMGVELSSLFHSYRIKLLN